MGYTFKDRPWKPRLHAEYEFLSGDDPDTATYEAWDPVLARWTRWSNLYDQRWSWEGDMKSAYTNLQRFTLGAASQPTDKLQISLDYSYLLANEHTFGKTFLSTKAPYDSGSSRGQLVAAELAYKFSSSLVGKLRAEYFRPGSYYDEATDDAVFLRWELTFTF
jgi:hypothetical protein